MGRPSSKSDESCSSGKSESISPSKKVDLDDKDVKRLRKRSHSQSTESKRSLSNSEEKELRTSRTERSTSAASDDKIFENEKEDTFERAGSNGSNSNKINSDGNR